MKNGSLNINKAKKMNPVGEVTAKCNKQIVDSLNVILADEFALFTKTLNFHWNVTGPRFHSLHTFLDEQYRDLLTIMDDVAERVRVLGSRPLGSAKEMLSNMGVKESTSTSPTPATEMLSILLRDHLQVQAQIKTAVSDKDAFDKDPGTEDFLIGILQKHEKMSWMLKSHLDVIKDARH